MLHSNEQTNNPESGQNTPSPLGTNLLTLMKNVFIMNMHRYFVNNICDSCTLLKQLQTQDVTNRRSMALNSVSIDVSVLQGRTKTFVKTLLF